MRVLLLPVLAALCLGFAVQETGRQALFITTDEESSITLYAPSEEVDKENVIVFGNRSLAVCLPEGASVEVDDMDSADVRARLDAGRLTWDGNLDVRVVRDNETVGRYRVRGGTVVLGPVERGSPVLPACN